MRGRHTCNARVGLGRQAEQGQRGIWRGSDTPDRQAGDRAVSQPDQWRQTPMGGVWVTGHVAIRVSKGDAMQGGRNSLMMYARNREGDC